MKKQIKQKQDDTQAKQNPNRNSNASANENRTPVSDETKQKLVKQYRDRAERESSNQNETDRRPSMLGGNGNPIDFVAEQPQALTHAVYDDNGFLPSPRAEYSSGGRNAIQNAQYYDTLGDYNRFFTQNALNNEMSGPDANAIYYANGMTVPEQNLINQIANLAYNKVENERIDQQDYQKALIAQMLQSQTPQGLSLLEQLGNRPLSRQRNITGSAVW